MALEGQLKDFNLAEILQLIASQQKSGFLILEGQRNMVFVFDKGVLISTRDRRNESPDPLEVYLRNYGFFNQNQWTHIGFVRENSSLDLTEILVSEQLLNEETLQTVLKAVAVEMAHRGMKMRHGRYQFNATRDTPPGVRGRIRVDVQGLLMEAARRVDEETQLAEIFPTQAVTFRQGPKPPPGDAMSPASQRLYKLALTGRPLGRILRRARLDSFTSRELLKNFLDEGWLEIARSTDSDGSGTTEDAAAKRRRRTRSLRHPVGVLVGAVLLLAVGGIRWGALPLGEMATVGLAAPVVPADDPSALPVSWLDRDQQSHRDLRLRQIRDEVARAAALYRHAHGSYPPDLDALVTSGALEAATRRTVQALGWRYAPQQDGLGYHLALD